MKLQFKPGVTGITGKNGTGKSSIIEAILFAFTGKLFTGDKAQAIEVVQRSPLAGPHPDFGDAAVAMDLERGGELA